MNNAIPKTMKNLCHSLSLSLSLFHPTASLKPSIELTVIAPKLFGSAQSRKDLRFHTASKTGSSPKFNESFKL